MHRIDHVTKSADLHGVGKDGFTEGDPVGGVAPTVVTDDWLNAVQEEIAAAVESGYTLSKPSNRQLAQMLELMALGTWQSTDIERDGTAADLGEGAITVPGGFQQTDTEARYIFAGDGATAGISGLWVSQTGEEWQIVDVDPPSTVEAAAVKPDSVAANSVLVLGSNGMILTNDGDIYTGGFTARTAGGGYAGTFRAGAWSGSLWCIVGSGGGIQTSPDGITWTARTPAGGYTGVFIAVGYGNGTFVAVGDAGEIQTSADGITWTSRANNLTGVQRHGSVVYSAELGRWVAVGGAGPIIEYSDDNGASWTEATFNQDGVPSGLDLFSSVVWTGRCFVAALGDIAVTPQIPVLYYSFDGITWQQLRAGTLALNGMRSCYLQYGAGRVVAAPGDLGKFAFSGRLFSPFGP